MILIFFLRNRTLRPYNIKNKTKRNYKESWVTRGAISLGVVLYQTCSSLPDLEFLAKQWATKLPICFTWEKQQDWKSLAKNRTSWITWPYSGWDESFCLSAFITTSASPSIMHCTTPRSLAKNNALWHARSSTIAAKEGIMIRWDKALITAPVELRTTTPIPAHPNSLNVAPSKLILRWGESGGVHLPALAHPN